MSTKIKITVAEDDNDPRIAMQVARMGADPKNMDNDSYLAMLEEHFERPENAAAATPFERELYVRFASLMGVYRMLEEEYHEDVCGLVA